MLKNLKMVNEHKTQTKIIKDCIKDLKKVFLL